ncbi:MAG: alkaline phosphatase D family protein [Terricaulis sp.]
MSKGWTRRGALTGIGLTTAAAAACTPKIEAPLYDGALTFSHGVASGDPGNDRVVIWTRVTPQQVGAVPVRWVVARNRELTDVVKTGVFETNEARDYTVKVDVTGLRAGAPYFYGFLAGDQTSPIGKTSTLPRGSLESLKLAVVSCASFPHGFFNAYEAIGARDDVDLVVHLGDYIYEFGADGYGSESAIALGRIPSPEVECLRVEDYRLRHAQAKAEPELQAAHAVAPWVVVWDDHETANDAWTSGADNHQPQEGDWAARKRAALQAYYEWMPIREPEAGRAFEAINRSFQFGDLFTLVMVETRLLARTRPFNYATDIPVEMRPWDFSNPTAPRPLPIGTPPASNTRMLPVPYEEVNGELRPVSDWARVGPAVRDPAHLPAGLFFMPDVPTLNAALATPDRVMLGEAQEAWLASQIASSAQAGTTWQVLGNQVLMTPIIAPDLSQTPAPLAAALERLRPGVTTLLGFTRALIPLNPDAWDGYPAARARVYEMFRASSGNALVLSGDSHSAWASELEDAQGRVAVELGTTAITSPSDASFFVQAGVDFGGGIRARNPHIKWTDQLNRGFLILSLTKTEATAEFFTVSTVTSKEYEVARAAAFTIAAAEGPGVGAITPVT